MTRAHAIIRTTLTIGAETPLLGVGSPLLAPLQRSLLQQVNLQSVLAPVFSACLQAFNTVAAAFWHCDSGKQPFAYCFFFIKEILKLTSSVPQLLMPSGQEISF